MSDLKIYEKGISPVKSLAMLSDEKLIALIESANSDLDSEDIAVQERIRGLSEKSHVLFVMGEREEALGGLISARWIGGSLFVTMYLVSPEYYYLSAVFAEWAKKQGAVSINYGRAEQDFEHDYMDHMGRGSLDSFVHSDDFESILLLSKHPSVQVDTF
jgi:hypothetical protein